MLPHNRPSGDDRQNGKPGPGEQGHPDTTDKPPPVSPNRAAGQQRQPQKGPTNSDDGPPPRHPPLHDNTEPDDEERHTPNGDQRGKADGNLSHGNLVGRLKLGEQNPGNNNPRTRSTRGENRQLRTNGEQGNQPTPQQPISRHGDR